MLQKISETTNKNNKKVHIKINQKLVAPCVAGVSRRLGGYSRVQHYRERSVVPLTTNV